MPDPDDYIGFLFSDVARLMRTAFDRRMRKLGLTRAQWMVLTRLHRRGGASQSELADMMEMERATTGRLIDRLEANGWVVRRTAPGDRRVNRIYLTAAAERVHKRIWKIAESTVDDAMAGLTQPEKTQLSGLLARVKSQLLIDLAAVPRRPSAAKRSVAVKSTRRGEARPILLDGPDEAARKTTPGGAKP